LIDDLVKRAQNENLDVLCLQEMFDNFSYFGLGKAPQQKLIEGLKPYFPCVVYDIGHRTWPFVSSGLIVFSKHPILEVDYFRYPNLRGIDTLSNKGFVGVKIQKNDRFLTVYNTHTQAGDGGLPTKWMEYLTRKKNIKWTGEIRGEGLGMIHEHIKLWADAPPQSAPHLKHLDTYLLGDLNQGMNNFEKVYAISHNKTGKEGRVAGQVKYDGQNKLMHDFSVHLADNFVDCRYHKPVTAYKTDKINWVQEARLEAASKNIINDIVTELQQTGQFDDHTKEQLQQEIGYRFRMKAFPGSVVGSNKLINILLKERSFEESAKNARENLLDNDCAREKYLDVCFSADFDRAQILEKRGLFAFDRKCLLFTPRQEDNHRLYTDHAGIVGNFSYFENKSFDEEHTYKKEHEYKEDDEYKMNILDIV
jgi:endonuclease/exonuclease/phosphatase family metal-dependent hydrolase